MADDWVSPDGFVDAGNGWNDEAKAYDDDEGTAAFSETVEADDNSEIIEFTHAAINCDKIRFKAYSDSNGDVIEDISVAVWYEDGWHGIYAGLFTQNLMTEKSIPAGTKSVTKIGMFFINDSGEDPDWAYITEVDFNQVAVGIARPLVGGSLAAGRKGLV